jgi:rsbT co-antagonist protein RsbR
VSSGSESSTIVLDEERLERLMNAVAFASAGAFDEALESIAHFESDRFGEIEEMLRVFFVELQQINKRVEEVISELTAARRDLEAKLETIERQKIAIRDLSSPIVDVWNGVLALPLIGPIDAARAIEMSETLLRRIDETGATWVLLDLTGVVTIDSLTANHIIRLARAARLLGSRCLITGMKPEVARTLVALGIDLTDLRPLRSLKEGLKFCLTRRSRRSPLMPFNTPRPVAPEPQAQPPPPAPAASPDAGAGDHEPAQKR